MIWALMAVAAAYLLGSLSTALIVSKCLGMSDPRTYGSGNPGASNMLRSGRKDAAAWTLAGDLLKGLVAVSAVRCLVGRFDWEAYWVGLAAIAVVAGHMWPVFFRFKGGKGVATAFGAIIAMSAWTAFWCALVWAAVAFKFKKSSLAALVAAAVAPFAAFIIIGHPSWGWSLMVVSALVVWRHRDNIHRMRNGSELLIDTKVVSEDEAGTQAADTDKTS